MERGYVKLWRKTQDSGLMQNHIAFTLFCALLFNASIKGRSFTSNGVTIELSPGVAIFSRVRMASELNISEQQARTALKFLEKLKIVTTKPTNRFTLVSFVNWDTYQQSNNVSQPTNQPALNQQITSSQPADNQHLTTSYRKKECKKEESNNLLLGEASSQTTKTTRFAPPSVEEVNAYCKEKGYAIDGQAFCDYYEARGWMLGKVKMKSWTHAVSTWVRNGFSNNAPKPKAWEVKQQQEIDRYQKLCREVGW